MLSAVWKQGATAASDLPPLRRAVRPRKPRGSSRSSPSTSSARRPHSTTRAHRVHRVRGRARPALPVRANRPRRQRAEPQPVLACRSSTRAAATQPRRAYEQLLAVTYDALKGADAKLDRRRREPGAARRRRPDRLPSDALADRVHQGPRRRVPRKRTHDAADGHVLDPRLRRVAEDPAVVPASRTRPRSGSPTTTSSSRCSDRRSTERRSRARSSRSSTASTASRRTSRRRARLHRRRGRPDGGRPDAGARLPSGDRARRVPEERARARLLPRDRRTTADGPPERAVLPRRHRQAERGGGEAHRGNLSARERRVRRVHLLPRRSGVAAAAGRGARRRQGCVRRGGRGARLAVRAPAHLLGDRRAARHRLLPLEDQRALRGPRRARRGAQRDAARRLARDAVQLPRDDARLAVHVGAQGAQDRAEGQPVSRRLSRS